MRTLHNIGRYEQPIARGQYRVLYNGQDTGKVEHWNLHRLPDGSSALRADVDSRAVTDPSVGTENLLVHMLLDPGGSADRLHVRYHHKQQKAEAQLTFFPDYAMVTRFVDGQALPQAEVELPDDVLVLAPCLASNAAYAYDEQKGGRQTVEVLDLRLDGPEVELLAPRMRSVAFSLKGTEDIELAGVGSFLARHLVEDDSVDVRLDMNDVVLTRTERDTAPETITAVLSQYIRFDG